MAAVVQMIFKAIIILIIIHFEQVLSTRNHTIDIVKILTNALIDLCDENQDEIVEQDVFDSVSQPSISLFDYLDRIRFHAQCDYEDFVVAFIYLTRYFDDNPELGGINWHNVHRLIAVSTLTAIKFRNDAPLTNKFYAQVYGVSTQGMRSESVLIDD